MYSTYDQYQEQGGPLNEARYRILAEKAASIIDYRTLHRAGSAPAEMRPCLALAECELVEFLIATKRPQAALQARILTGIPTPSRQTPPEHKAAQSTMCSAGICSALTWA